MRSFKTSLLNHFKSVQGALDSLKAVAYLNLLDFKVTVRFGGTEVMLIPQFITRGFDGRKRYTPVYDSKAGTFIGWLPYFNKRWVLAREKLQFKKYAIAHGLSVPDYSVDANSGLNDVIVKCNMSSFGADIRGPFRNANQHKLDQTKGEYYERFVRGRIAKIWFWNAQPICLEFQESVAIVGDGKSSVKELLERNGGFVFSRKKTSSLLHYCDDYLAYQGKTIDSVPAQSERVDIDFRYGSPFVGPWPVEDVDLQLSDLSPDLAHLKLRFEAIGLTLAESIPEGIRKNCAFTVDAIIDPEGREWLLEMNSNPFIHPLMYPVMLRDLAEDAKYQAPIAPMPPAAMLHGVNAGVVDAVA